MKKVRAFVLAVAALSIAAPLESIALPLSGATYVIQAQAASQSLLNQVQYRRYNGQRAVRGPAPGRAPVRGAVRRGRGGGGGAAAAIIGLGVLGAIAANKDAKATCGL